MTADPDTNPTGPSRPTGPTRPTCEVRLTGLATALPPNVLVQRDVVARAREVLGWTPTRTLDDIVRTAWRWHAAEIERSPREPA